VFDQQFMDTVVGRMDLNEAIFKRILDDEEFRRTLMEMYATRVYRRARTKDVRQGFLSESGRTHDSA